MNQGRAGTGHVQGPWSDYHLPHPDIRHAAAVEPYHDLLRMFALRTRELITLSLSAVYTLARIGEGLMTEEDLGKNLSHLTPETRGRVRRILLDYGWIVSHGVGYEIPERAKALLMLLFGPLTTSAAGLAQDIRLAFAMTDLDEAVGTDPEQAEDNFEVAVHTLRAVRDRLQRAIEQRSRSEVQRLLTESARVRAEIAEVMNRMRRRNRIFYRYSNTTGVLELCSEINRMYGDLLLFINHDVQANARAFGQYLSPEQVEEFLQKADKEVLARLARRRFASPRTHTLVTHDEVMTRGLTFLQHQPEVQPPTPAPPVFEIERHQVIVHRQEGAAQQYYHDLMARLRLFGSLSLADAIIKDTWGKSLFHAGLLVGVRRELADNTSLEKFELDLEDRFIPIPDGPVARITAGTLSLPGTKEAPIDVGS